MMTAKDAYLHFMSKYKNYVVRTCYEYDSIYVFDAIPNSIKDVNALVLDSLWSVDKKNGKILNFKPFHISLSEYERGRKVIDYK